MFKSDVREVQKYFKPITQHPESIKNRYGADTENAFIEIDFVDENSDLRTKRISDSTVNTRPTRTNKFIEQITLSSDFIDYKSIFNIYNFANRERVKLFKYFEKNLLPFINLRNNLVEIEGSIKSKNLTEWWDYLKKGLNPYPNIGGDGYWAFQSLIDQFNQ